MRYKNTILLLLFFLFLAKTALPCGGPGYAVIDSPLASFEEFLTDLSVDYDEYYDYGPIKESRFLYPFYLTEKSRFQNLWNHLYRYADNAEDVASKDTSLADFATAIQNGDLPNAKQHAAAIIQQIIDLPLFAANERQEDLKRALEFVELQPWLQDVDPKLLRQYFIERMLPEEAQSDWPRLQASWVTIQSWFGYKPEIVPDILKQAERIRLVEPQSVAKLILQFPQSPRLATLEFVLLKEAMRTQIPDGYVDEIQRNVTSETWQTLENQHAQWLQKFPTHPLVDWVKLSLVHLYYLQGTTSKSWDLLLEMYPRHQLRLLGEMRFLLLQGHIPSALDHPKIDAQLLAALIPSMTLTEDEWNRSWQISEQNLSQPWGSNMQERLLLQAVKMAMPQKTLPKHFPTSPKNPTPLWGALRALALVSVGKWSDADEQMQTLNKDGANAVLNSLQARIDMQAGRIVKTILKDHLQPDVVNYLIRVLAEDVTLAEIINTNPKSAEATDARVTQAIRLVGLEKWDAAAALMNDKIWQEAAILQTNKSPSGLLAWAHFLEKNNDALFFAYNREWYIAISDRYNAILRAKAEEETASPVTRPLYFANEEQKIKSYLMNSSETYYALKAYTAWLKQASPKDQGYAKIVKKADTLYNDLINRANWSADFWLKILETSDEALTIRAAGKAL